MFVRFCAALIAIAGLAPSLASAGVFKNAPDAVVCPFAATAKRPTGSCVFYVDTRYRDGRLVYKPLGGGSPLFLIVGSNDVVKAGGVAECSGKSLNQRRNTGRAFDFRWTQRGDDHENDLPPPTADPARTEIGYR